MDAIDLTQLYIDQAKGICGHNNWKPTFEKVQGIIQLLIFFQNTVNTVSTNDDDSEPGDDTSLGEDGQINIKD